MSRGQDRGTLDWLVELAGAIVPAAAAGFAAQSLAPSFGVAPGMALMAGFGTMFALAYMLMRAVRPEPRVLVLPVFEQQEVQDDVGLLIEALARDALLRDTADRERDEVLVELPDAEPDELPVEFSQAEPDELLLDSPYEEPDELLLDRPLVEPADLATVAELLLDDPLPAPAADSRVVQLFADGRMPTAGQLQRRIDRHLSAGERPAVKPDDASDALGEALAELRRSLRQG